MKYLQIIIQLICWTNTVRNQESYFGLMMIKLRAEFNYLLIFFSNLNRVTKSDYIFEDQKNIHSTELCQKSTTNSRQPSCILHKNKILFSWFALLFPLSPDSVQVLYQVCCYMNFKTQWEIN